MPISMSCFCACYHRSESYTCAIPAEVDDVTLVGVAGELADTLDSYHKLVKIEILITLSALCCLLPLAFCPQDCII